VIRSKSFNPIAAAFHLIAFSMLLAGVIALTPQRVKQGKPATQNNHNAERSKVNEFLDYHPWNLIPCL